MSQEAVEKILGRLLTDDGFRCRAFDSLAELCRTEGYAISAEELRVIGRDELVLLGSVATKLDGSIKRFPFASGASRTAPVQAGTTGKPGTEVRS